MPLEGTPGSGSAFRGDTQRAVVPLEVVTRGTTAQERLDKLALIQVKTFFIINDNGKKIRQQTT